MTMVDSTTIESMSNKKLSKKLHYLSQHFCINPDYSTADEMYQLLETLQSVLTESVLRIIETKLNYRPETNKLSKLLDIYFCQEDAYNIRQVLFINKNSNDRAGLKSENLQWFKNRIQYSVRMITNQLLNLNYYKYGLFQKPNDVYIDGIFR